MNYSAGIIPFRRNENGVVEFFVGHPGGEGWKCKDYWSFLKGGVEGDEKWEETALREFKEETGLSLEGITKNNLIPLGTTNQNKYKIVIAFALYYPNIDVDKCFSNLVDNETFPEIDRYAWMNIDELKVKSHPTHIAFYEQIIDMIS